MLGIGTQDSVAGVHIQNVQHLLLVLLILMQQGIVGCPVHLEVLWVGTLDNTIGVTLIK